MFISIYNVNIWNNIILSAFASHVYLVLVEETLNRTNGYPECFLTCSAVQLEDAPSTVRCLINSLKPVPLLNILKIEDFMRWCPTFAVSLSTILIAFCQYLQEAWNYVSMIDIPHLHYNRWEYRFVLMPKEDIQCYYLGSLSCNEWSVYMNIC